MITPDDVDDSVERLGPLKKLLAQCINENAYTPQEIIAFMASYMCVSCHAVGMSQDHFENFMRKLSKVYAHVDKSVKDKSK